MASAAKTPSITAAFTDTRTLRANARKNVGDGAVTKDFPADRETIIEKLNESLATEWVCVLRYMRHYHTASGLVSEPIKAHFLEHAKEEQAHATALAERIVQLGGEPDLNPDNLTKKSHAEYREGKTLKEMVTEDLIAERIAIQAYRELIHYLGERDPTTRKLVEHILEQEEEHADEFSDLLDGWEGE
ncbi:ferritin-like domain-containing protein [Novosphingobium sp.]|uniref:ferritin-like domain-containing protein n=1 Tax=Novosphingobium sp. TaxID=1874826 RepID=UPI00286BB7F4|nr:ferritin-like domain-containing protein [Novosphingobium sp.]